MTQGNQNRYGEPVRGKWYGESLQSVMSAAWICAFVAIGAWVIIDMRQSAWHESASVSQNILDVTSRSIERDIELYDLSIKAAAANLARADVRALPKELRRLAVFDNSASAKGLGRMHYTNAAGDLVDTTAGDPNGVNVSDRDYFIAHRANPNLGLFIGKPITGRIGKERYIVLSRRLQDDAGGFAGVVVGQIKLAFLREFFSTIRQGEGGQIGLYSYDGTVMLREPSSPADRREDDLTIAGTPAQESFASSLTGTFMTEGTAEDPERTHIFDRIAGTNLVLDVAVSTDAVLAPWKSRAAWMALVMFGLTGTLVLLVKRNQRELALRRLAEREALVAKREALRLSETDTLTGLANRRMFNRAVETELKAAASAGEPLTLAVIDVDHFKRFNDTYGHAQGDAVLKALSARLSEMTQRSGEIACRIGGEEFAIVLPNLGVDAALQWAELTRGNVADQVFDGPLEKARVTVSIGLAQALPGESVADLVERADGALYEAKHGGRNTVRTAGRTKPRLVAA